MPPRLTGGDDVAVLAVGHASGREDYGRSPGKDHMSDDAPAVDTLTVALVQADDLPELADLAARTFPLACPPGTTRQETDRFVADHLSLAALERYLADDARRLLLARSVEMPGAPAVGYAMTVAGDPTDPDVAAAVTDRPTVELSKCYTDLAVHGRGVAARLVEAALELARTDVGPAGTCWLGVNQDNVRARRFYTKQGFVVVGTKQFDVGGQRHDDFVMARPLATP